MPGKIVVDGVSLYLWRKQHAKVFGAEKPINFKLLSENIGDLLVIIKSGGNDKRFVDGLTSVGINSVCVEGRYYNAHTIECAKHLCRSDFAGIVTSDESFIPIAKEMGKTIYSSQFLSDPKFLQAVEGENIAWLKTNQLFR